MVARMQLFTRLAAQLGRRGQSERRPERAGFTLVELLVVIAIIGVLVAILLPAIQAAREAGRRNQCRNNLKQMALGADNHLLVHKFLPSGGWGWGWTGDPNYGYDTRQPGGWMFNLLPFIEEQAVHDLGKGIVPDTNPARHTALKQLATVIPLYFCPTRRVAETTRWMHGTNFTNIGSAKPEFVARNDYVACQAPWQFCGSATARQTIKLGAQPATDLEFQQQQQDEWTHRVASQRFDWH